MDPDEAVESLRRRIDNGEDDYRGIDAAVLAELERYRATRALEAGGRVRVCIRNQWHDGVVKTLGNAAGELVVIVDGAEAERRTRRAATECPN